MQLAPLCHPLGFQRRLLSLSPCCSVLAHSSSRSGLCQSVSPSSENSTARKRGWAAPSDTRSISLRRPIMTITESPSYESIHCEESAGSQYSSQRSSRSYQLEQLRFWVLSAYMAAERVVFRVTFQAEAQVHWLHPQESTRVGPVAQQWGPSARITQRNTHAALAQ
eukprot:SAG25_NODE_2386_length_1662_cov_1.215611_2_plen_166_part_00